MELLSQKLGIPMTGITKRGGNSWIVCEHELGEEG
jgi:hypothetical protein